METCSLLAFQFQLYVYRAPSSSQFSPAVDTAGPPYVRPWPSAFGMDGCLHADDADLRRRRRLCAHCTYITLYSHQFDRVGNASECAECVVCCTATHWGIKAKATHPPPRGAVFSEGPAACFPPKGAIQEHPVCADRPPCMAFSSSFFPFSSGGFFRLPVLVGFGDWTMKRAPAHAIGRTRNRAAGHTRLDSHAPDCGGQARRPSVTTATANQILDHVRNDDHDDRRGDPRRPPFLYTCPYSWSR